MPTGTRDRDSGIERYLTRGLEIDEGRPDKLPAIEVRRAFSHKIAHRNMYF